MKAICKVKMTAQDLTLTALGHQLPSLKYE